MAAEAAAKAERERAAREAALEAKRRKKEAEQAEIRRFEEEARRDLLNAAKRRAGKR